MRKMVSVGACALFGLGAVMAAQPAAAIDYTDRQVTILIGYGYGGTYGKYSRTIADHIRKHIPGNPNVIVQSMPGAGGLKAANYAGNVMPAQGFNILMPPDTTVVSQLLRPTKVKYDARKFTWLGTSNQTNVIMVVRKDTGVKSWEDMKTKQVIAGNTGPGSTSFLMPAMMKGLLGLNIKLIQGYKGSRKTILAMEQGEHTGTGFNWLAWDSIVPHWFEKGKEFAIPVMQTGVWKDPALPNVPMMRDVVKPEDKPIVSFMATLGIIGRGLTMPPGTPQDAITVLRAAFEKTMKDPAYVADAKKRRLRVIPASGEEIQKVVNEAFASAKPEVVARAAQVIFGKK
jgi:tripartite-type tricarboxylate transporter receptor subunit TctC